MSVLDVARDFFQVNYAIRMTLLRGCSNAHISPIETGEGYNYPVSGRMHDQRALSLTKSPQFR